MCSQTRNSCAKAFGNRSRSKTLKPKKSRGGQFDPPPPPQGFLYIIVLYLQIFNAPPGLFPAIQERHKCMVAERSCYPPPPQPHHHHRIASPRHFTLFSVYTRITQNHSRRRAILPGYINPCPRALTLYHTAPTLPF